MSSELRSENILKDIKDVTEEFKAGFESFKKANDERITTSVDRLNEKLSELETAKKSLEQEIIELKRPSFNGNAPDSYEKDFNHFVKTGQTTEEFITKGFDSSSSNGGSYAIPEQLDKRIIELLHNESPMRRVCAAYAPKSP